MRYVRFVALAWPLVLVTACGNSRAPVPNFSRPASPTGSRVLSYPRAGIAFDAPRNWSVVAQRTPLVATVDSGAAVVAVWRYPRTGRKPSTPGALARYESALVRAGTANDRTLHVISWTISAVEGAPAIVLEASESVSGLARRVQSVHIYRSHAEMVIDEYAPANAFDAVNRQVFTPLVRSIRLFPPSTA